MSTGFTFKLIAFTFFVLSVYFLFEKTKSQDYDFAFHRMANPDINNFCGTEEMNRRLTGNEPALKKVHENLERDIYSFMQNRSGERTPPNFTLPVVIHVIHDNGTENISDAQVLQGIQHLNESFANTGYYDPATGVNTGIQFCLAKRDPDDNFSNGITRDVSPLTEMTMGEDDLALKNINRWEPLDYINIWLVREICSNSIGCGVAGYAYLPYAHGGSHDGIVIEAEWFGSSPANSTVLTHEMGHYLGLFHTFNAGCENDNCLTNGDRVCDTPPDQSSVGVPCTASPNSCNTDVNPGDPNNPFTTDQNDMFWNYMDYGNLACYTAFTSGQTVRMEWHINGPRSSLLDSDGCIEACMIPIVPLFIPSESPVAIGLTVNFINQSTNASNFQWLINGIPFSNSVNPVYTFPTEGIFEITLNATNSDPNCFESYSITIEVVCPVTVDFIADDLTVALNDSVNFTNLSSSADNFEWLIDGVSFSTSFDASMVFTTEGVYEITLIAHLITPACSESYSIFIEVICPVEADFVADNSIVPANETVSFANTSSNAINYEWSVNGISQGNSIDFNLSLSNPGIIQVCLEASGLYCTDIHCEFISITSSSEGCYHTFEKTIGNEDEDEGGSSVITSPDGNLFLAGYKGDSALIIKITPNGDVIWQRIFKFTDDIYNCRISEIIIDSDNNIVGCGFGIIDFIPDGSKQGFAFKYDHVNNAILWCQKLEPECQAFNIIETGPEANYILTANMHVPWYVIDSNEKALLFELDRNTGSLTGNLGFKYFIQSNGAFTTTLIHDGFLFANGHYDDNPWDISNKSNSLSKLDMNGNIQWSRYSFLPISGSGKINGIDMIKDVNAFVIPIIGDTFPVYPSNEYFFLQKSDLDGNLIWVKKYSLLELISVYPEELISVYDGYIIFGYGNTPGQNSVKKLFLLKTNKNGEVIWIKYFEGENSDNADNYAPNRNQYPSQLLEFQGHLYFTATKINTSGIGKDILLIKTDLNGNVSSNCESETGYGTWESFPDPVNNSYDIIKEPATNSFTALFPVVNSASLADSLLCSSFCIEICDNSRDDDGDSLIDFYDPDCPCNDVVTCGTPFYNICAVEYCENPDTSIHPIEMEVLWSSPNCSRSGPSAVGDIDGDCVPDIVALDSTFTILNVFDSNNGNVRYSFELEYIVWSDIAIGDVDLDGMAEIFLTISLDLDSISFIYRYDYNPISNNLEQTWQSSSAIYTDWYWFLFPFVLSPGLADFDYNGIPEVYAGNYIFDSQTGQFLVHGGSNNIGLANSPIKGSVAVDILSDEDCLFCQGLELVAGSQVYTVHIASYTNPDLNSMLVEKELSLFTERVDGITSVADFDRDGDLDVIFISNSPTLYVWDVQNESLIGDDYTFQNPSDPLHSAAYIVDTDQDDWPEIVISGYNKIIILEDYLNGGGTNWGENNPNTLKAEYSSSGSGQYTIATELAIFDLNGDGQLEIITKVFDSIFIFDSNLNIIVANKCEKVDNTLSLVFAPIIADINADGQSEFLCFCNETGLTAFQSANIPWVNSRKIWNQSNYFVANVNDDGTIPVQQQLHHIVGDSVVMNTFLVQQPVLNDQGALVNPLPDAMLNIDSAICNGDVIDVFMTICNNGDYLLNESTPLAFYNGDPTNTEPIWSHSISLETVIKPDSCFSFSYPLSNAFNDPIFVVINDDLSGTYPFDPETDFPFTSIAECDYGNNMDSFLITAIEPPVLELGPDIVVCENEVFEFSAGSGFDHYYWQDGSADSSYTSFTPGEYWVKAWNDCGIVQIDTVSVTVDSTTILDLGPDVVLCKEGESVSFSAPGFDHYQWFPANSLDCDTCSSVTATPPGSTTYILVTNSDLACISVDSVTVTINEFSWTPVTGSVIDASCFGESDGSYQIDSLFSNYLFSLNGENFQNVLAFDALSAGVYSLFVQDEFGCIYSQEFSIGQSPQLEIGLPELVTIELGDSIMINPTVIASNNLVYHWEPAELVNCPVCPEITVMPFENTTYFLTVTDANGCADSAEIFIEVDKKRNVFIPNVFSPNADGINDIFMIYGGKGIKEVVSFTIFDRWGEQLFEVKNYQPNDPVFGWNGTFKGKELNPQVYVYIAEIAFLDGEIISFKGDVTLVK